MKKFIKYLLKRKFLLLIILVSSFLLGFTTTNLINTYTSSYRISFKIEDDSVVTSGGVGQALIGGALFGGLGAVAGGLTGKRVQKKRIESLYIKVTLNSFKTPFLNW